VNKTVKIVLINPPIPDGVFRHQPYLPIGLAYLAAVLERSSHEVKILDCPTLRINYEQLKKKIGDFDPEVAGITSMTPTINSAFAAAHAVKEVKSDAMVVIGGPHATFMDEQILSDVADIDIVVRGEGEQTITEVVQKYANHEKLCDVAGITFRKKDEIIRTSLSFFRTFFFRELSCFRQKDFSCDNQPRMPIPMLFLHNQPRFWQESTNANLRKRRKRASMA
jgi:radical SAM superfamily enzyme YgiQ (UPF0313 family)